MIKTVLGTTATIGGSGAGTYIVYESQRETAWPSVREDVLLESISLEDWKIKEEELQKETSLKFGLEKIKKSTSSSATGEYLKKWCLENYKGTFRDWFRERNGFVDTVKKYCKLDIKSRLSKDTESQIFSSSDTDAMKKKLFETERLRRMESRPYLSKYSTGYAPSIDDPSLAKKAEELLKWCLSTYEKGFQGKYTFLWKLTNAFCKKTVEES